MEIPISDCDGQRLNAVVNVRMTITGYLKREGHFWNSTMHTYEKINRGYQGR